MPIGQRGGKDGFTFGNLSPSAQFVWTDREDPQNPQFEGVYILAQQPEYCSLVL